ncbi:unnamed protein product [Caenorhabditis sp. 36 PRJEB53466]|nr:unnamed protein product [Caenorhabditis sp. 36 PRJEB53466]
MLDAEIMILIQNSVLMLIVTCPIWAFCAAKVKKDRGRKTLKTTKTSKTVLTSKGNNEKVKPPTVEVPESPKPPTVEVRENPKPPKQSKAEDPEISAKEKTPPKPKNKEKSKHWEVEAEEIKKEMEKCEKRKVFDLEEPKTPESCSLLESPTQQTAPSTNTIASVLSPPIKKPKGTIEGGFYTSDEDEAEDSTYRWDQHVPGTKPLSDFDLKLLGHRREMEPIAEIKVETKAKTKAAENTEAAKDKAKT